MFIYADSYNTVTIFMRMNKMFNDLQGRKVEIPFSPLMLSSPFRKIAGISNLNFLGGVSFLLVGEGPGQPVRQGIDNRTHHIIAIANDTLFGDKCFRLEG